MVGVESLIDMKKEFNNLGVNSYDWFFNNLENNYLTKVDGTERNVEILKRYDEEAKKYALVQLAHINEDATVELMGALSIKNASVAEEYQAHVQISK